MLNTFYVIVATLPSDELKFVGKDENSGGYPYLSDYAQIYYDDKYFEALKKYIHESFVLKDLQLKPINLGM